MHTRPKLSIIIPNHNYARFLPRLLASLAAQSTGLARTEIILADDASDDDSVAVAERAAPDLGCARFRVLRLERHGRPGPVRNAGLRVAEGGYLLCVDADDRLHPEFLAGCQAVLDAHPEVGVVYTDYFVRSPDADGPERAVGLPDFDHDLLRTQNILLSAAMFRRAVLDAAEGFQVNTAYEDWDFWVRAAARGHRFAHLRRPLYHYETHDGNYFAAKIVDDGHAKAALVLNNPEYFHPDVVRWAQGYVEGEMWAKPFRRGLIPRPQDVADLFRAFRAVLRDYKRKAAVRAVDPHLRLLADAPFPAGGGLPFHQ